LPINVNRRNKSTIKNIVIKMTIAKDAIQHLEQTVLLENVNSELEKSKTKTPLIAMPSSISLENLESYMPNRSSFRMNFETKSINDFSNYAEEFDKEGAKCFVDSDNVSAKIIFDIGTEALPEHQRNTAKLRLDKTAAFSRLLSVNGERFNQKEAANFIEDWGDFIVVSTSSAEAMTIAQAANAITKLTIESARSLTSEMDDFSEHMSAMERVEVKNKDKMPSNIDFTCVPYGGLDERKFQIKLSVLTGGDKPQVSLRIVKLEQHKEDIIEEFKEILVGKFEKSELKTFIGTC